MNVSNIRQNNVNYVEIMFMLRDETIEIYLSVPQYARGRPLSDSLK